MPVTEVLGGLGSWSVKLSDECPDEVLQQLGFLGHIVIVRGRVDVAATSSSLLAAARYVGVLRDRSKDRRTLEGDGMLFWLGDEDDKGKVLESAVNLTTASISTAVSAVLPPAVHAGTINSAAGTYTGKHQYETPRSALDTIIAAFGVEYRVNGDATIDVGTQAQLYRTSPNTIIAARNAGADLDLTSLGATFAVDESIRDYSTRVLLLGSSFDNGTTTTFATGSADAPSVPYLDLWGNPVQLTRMISESGTTTGSVTQRAQLQLNRFNRQQTALKVTATDYEIAGPFAVGDNAYVYDPANGIFDAARSIDFRGELIHPDVVRISGATWPVTEDHTVAFRTQAGAWIDLTRWVMWETGGGEITVGDLPKSLTSAGGNPVQDRADGLPDATIPTAPSGLTLTTSAVVDPRGQNQAIVSASWIAPTLNTDGTVITDLAGYVVQYRPTFRAPQWLSTSTVATSIDLPATIDLDFDVRVAAQDRSGHVGAFTAVSTIHASVDNIAPTAPADPTVTSYLGQLRIAWSGTNNVGGAMPADFNRVDVHVSATSGFTPSTATLVSSLSTAGVAYATAPYGATRFVKLLAYDNAGNASAPSGQVSGATVQVADGDVAALSVGKLTAGTMSADVVTSGRFTTALTGARRELNSVGFQGWDASNNLIINLDGVNNLLTGMFKTGLTGRRIEMSAFGTGGEIQFIAPDGTTGKIRGFTGTVGDPGEEALQMGFPITGAYGAWNQVQVTVHEEIYAASGKVQVVYGGAGPSGEQLEIRYAPTHGSTLTSWTGRPRYIVNETNGHLWYTGWDGSSAFARMWIDSTHTDFRDPAGVVRFTMLSDRNEFRWPASGGTTSSGGFFPPDGGDQLNSMNLRLATGSLQAGSIRLRDEAAGTYFDMEVWTSSSWLPVRASAFIVSSDETLKQDIEPFTESALAAVRGTQIKRFRRREGRGPGMQHKVIKGRGGNPDQLITVPDPDSPAQPGPVELGVIAQEAPAVIVRKMAGTLGVDHSAWIALLHGSVSELADALDALAAEVAELKGATA